MKAKPFEPGQILGGYRVDALKHLGETIDDNTYDCHTICCGKEAIRSHMALYGARRRGNKSCKNCADRAYHADRRAKSRRQVGEILGHYQILGHVEDAYRVRTTCCQSELVKSHRQVTEAQRQGMYCCLFCKKAGFVKKAPEVAVTMPADTRQVWCLETQGLISAALAWPRPRSLAAC